MTSAILPLLLALLPAALALRGRRGAEVREQLVLSERHDWPAGRHGHLQRPWDFQVRIAAEPCTVGAADIACEGELWATPSTRVARPTSGPSYIVRAVGPTIEVCNATQSSETGPAGPAFVTRFTCRLRAGGAYELRPLLTYESQEEAYAAPPRCSSPCVCSDLKMPGAGFPSFVAPHAKLAPAQGTSGARWTQEAGGNWSFRADDHPGLAEAPDLSSTVPAPDSCPMLYFVGDSHIGGVFKFLEDRGYRAKFQRSFGIQNHYIPDMTRTVKNAHRGDCSYQDFHGGDGENSTLQFAADPLKVFPDLGKDDVVVVGAGTWDLRDSSVSDFVRDFELLSQRLAKVSKLARFVYRTAPAFSFKRAQAKLRGREMRTNERLMEANARVRELLPAGVALWDSLLATLPRFEESCDSHHYLCHRQPLEKNRIGIADLSLFLSSVCDMRKATAVEFSKGVADDPKDDADEFLDF